MALGSGKSSDSIWTVFDTETTAAIRYPRHLLEIAWTRVKNESATFALVGTSLVGGIDVVQGQLNVLTEPDKFKYFDETERAVELHYDRKIEEPLGGFTYTIGDVVLDNTTKRFTPNISNTIGTSLKPYRPMKMFMGFQIRGVDKLLPTLYGLTEQVKESKLNRDAALGCYDYIKYIDNYELESSMYVDKRTDEVISDILTTIGFTTSQFSLDTGLNTIGFAWFDKGTKAGDAIRKLVQAEEGHFYQNEEGLIKFDNRRSYNNNLTPMWTINKEDILDWRQDDSVDIINRVIVRAKPREVQTITEIWKDGVTEELAVGETKILWAAFNDPVSSISSPVETTDYVANSAQDGSGSDLSGDLGLTITDFTQTAKLTLVNNSGQTMYVTLLRLRGTPATITSEIEEVYEDRNSEDTYGRKQVEIENDFIDSRSFAYYMARAIVAKYRTPLKRILVTINAAPQLQIKDVVTLQDMDTNSYTNYRIMRIEGKMTPFNFTHTLTLREVTDSEADQYAIVGTSMVDGTDVVGI